MIDIRVVSCRSCPFVIDDNEFGYCGCNVSEEVTDSIKKWEELPSKGVHELCPLKKSDIKVGLLKE